MKLRVPNIFNLRRDPFERAEIQLEHVPGLDGRSRPTALSGAGDWWRGQIEEFKKYPPRQRPASFNLDAVLRAGAKPQVAWATADHPRRARHVRRGCRSTSCGGGSPRLLRPVSVSSACRRASNNIDSVWLDRRQASRRLPSLLAGRPLSGRLLHPDCRLRNVAGGQARDPLACSAGHRHRRERDQRPLHRRTSSHARPAQSPGPSAADRACSRTRDVASIRSCAPACCIISRTPTRDLPRCVTC